MAMVATMAMVLATLAFTMARGMPMLKPSPTTMARERLRLMLSPRLRLIPTTMVPTVLDMVDSMDMVSAMDMATVSTMARGRLRLRPGPTTMEDMEDTDMPAPTEDS